MTKECPGAGLECSTSDWCQLVCGAGKPRCPSGTECISGWCQWTGWTPGPTTPTGPNGSCANGEKCAPGACCSHWFWCVYDHTKCRINDQNQDGQRCTEQQPPSSGVKCNRSTGWWQLVCGSGKPPCPAGTECLSGWCQPTASDPSCNSCGSCNICQG